MWDHVANDWKTFIKQWNRRLAHTLQEEEKERKETTIQFQGTTLIQTKKSKLLSLRLIMRGHKLFKNVMLPYFWDSFLKEKLADTFKTDFHLWYKYAHNPFLLKIRKNMNGIY
jgi:hypothetical protein